MSPSGPVHAFTDDALGDDDATEVAARIRRGEVSSSEVCRAAVERAAKVQPLLEAVECTDSRAPVDLPLPAHGPFAGVPTFVKDNTDVAGLPTGQGTDALDPRPAVRDGPFVTQLRDLGLVPLGKSRLPEFGLNASTEFARRDPVRNPWDPRYSAGASSGGAAALVAAGVVPLAHGNDGGGSIRIPAAVCGLVGLKPTRGRLVADPLDERLPVRIVTEGVLTRTVRDTARFLAAAEQHHRNPSLPPVRSVEGPSRTRLRVAVLMDSPSDVPTDPETRASVSAVADLLSDLGHGVEEAGAIAPARFAEDFSRYWELLGLLLVRTGRRVFGPDFDAAATDNLTRGLADACRRELWRVPGSLHRLRRSTRDYRSFFTRYDVLLSPVLTHTTPPLGVLSPTLPFDVLFPRLQAYVGFTPLNNAAGGPAISLPAGLSRHGLPIGCHLSADLGDERTLLELAYELEAARPWSRIQDRAGTG